MSRLKIKELESPDWLKQKYLEEKLSMRAIGELLGCGEATVWRRLEAYNIPRRNYSQSSTLAQGYAQYKNREWLQEHYVKKELSSLKIAEQIGCSFQTVCRWLSEFDIPRRDPWCNHSQPSWNYRFFDELTPDSAYIIGMIIADGTLRKGRSYKIGITQQDRAILDKISDVVCGGTFSMANTTTCLTLSSKHAYKILIDKFGLPSGGQKSYTVRIPECLLEREDLLPHCIRGIFDGDGSVRRDGSYFAFFSGSPDLLNDIVNVLTRLVSLPNVEPLWRPGGFIKKNGERSGSYKIDYNGILDAIDFAKFIYGLGLDVYGSSLYLERKRERFQSVCERLRGREWLVEKLSGGWTPRQVADHLGIGLQIVTRQLKNLDGDFIPPWHDRDWLFQRFVVEGKSVGAIASELPDVESKNICHFVKRYDLYQERSKHWNLELWI